MNIYYDLARRFGLYYNTDRNVYLSHKNIRLWYTENSNVYLIISKTQGGESQQIETNNTESDFTNQNAFKVLSIHQCYFKQKSLLIKIKKMWRRAH